MTTRRLVSPLARYGIWFLVLLGAMVFPAQGGEPPVPSLPGCPSPLDALPLEPSEIHYLETNGKWVLVLARNEVMPAAGNLMLSSLWGDGGVLLYAGDRVNGAPREFTIPVDSTMRQMIVAVTTYPRGAVQLFTPTGRELAIGEPGVEVTNLAHGRMYKLAIPERGMWRLRIEAADVFWAGATALTDIDAYEAEFVRLAGRPGHEGLFPIQGQPVRGEEQTLSAVVFGPYASAQFKLISRAGRDLAELDLKKGDPNADVNEFIGKLTLPEEPFRVAVSGQDMSGFSYQRVFPILFRAQTAEVRFVSLKGSARPGSTAVASLEVRNVDPEADFIVAATALGGTVNVEPSSLSVKSGEKKVFTVTVAAPQDAKPLDRIEVRVTAMSTNNPCVGNWAEFSLEVPLDVKREPAR